MDVVEDYRGSAEFRLGSGPIGKAVGAVVDRLELVLGRRLDVVVVTRSAWMERFPGKAVYYPNPYPAHGRRSAPSPRRGQQLRLVHSGLFGAVRGSLVLARALEVAVEEMGIPSSQLALSIVGSFVDDSEAELLERAKSLGIDIQSHKWLDRDEAFDIVANSDVGLVLFQPISEGYRDGAPNKIFDYAAAGLAVIAPSTGVDIPQMVDRWTSGVLVDSLDPRELASAIALLASREDLRQEMAANAYKSIDEEFSTSKMFPAVLARVRQILGEARGLPS